VVTSGLQVPDAVKGDVRNSRALQRKLSAALVCSLANVNPFTKIVLMDTRGGTTKPLAREISAQGYRAYILKGGYTLWRRTGLATKKGTYDVSAGAHPISLLHADMHCL
jgi:rhodanese-related sulfurtransferase